MKNWFIAFTRNYVSLLGAIITTVSAIIIVSLFAMEVVGGHQSGGPYIGILAFLILPSFFIFGLILIPVGIWWERRRQAQMAARGLPPQGFPILDFNNDRTRMLGSLFIIATLINLVIIATTTYKGVEVMESTQFCGQTCHTVMDPEFTAYQRSPHARVKCVECHIGAGASWFVKSKLSGSWQLVSVLFNLYQKPIPTPVHNLRPARETCEECHWPTKFVGDKLKVITHFDEDEKNTEKKTVMMIRVGGSQAVRSHGIHWHVDPKNTVRYLSDDKRETIGDVELIAEDGSRKLFRAEGSALKEGVNAQWRTMDCVDCHNRPTHIYRSPVEELEAGMISGKIDKTLPFIRREGLKVLKQNYPDKKVAYDQMKQNLMDFYSKQLSDFTADRVQAVDAAAQELAHVYSLNVYPKMNIQWDTYRPNIGHERAPGCFRCHDEQHKLADGKTISMDCTTCHKLLAQEEKDPAILKQLGAEAPKNNAMR